MRVYDDAGKVIESHEHAGEYALRRVELGRGNDHHLSRVLVRLDHVASIIVNANHGIM